VNVKLGDKYSLLIFYVLSISRKHSADTSPIDYGVEVTSGFNSMGVIQEQFGIWLVSFPLNKTEALKAIFMN
jgi:hypothetical protein